jgi:hypothetical protein
VTQIVGSTVGGGPEGFVYVTPGSPQFPGPSMLVSEFDAGEVAAYEIDANGDPLVATRRTFVDGLTGAEGAMLDPVTGDFLFSTFGGGDRIVAVRGFAAAAGARLTVITRVVNDNGGSAAASAWTMHVRSAGVDVTGSPFAGADAPGVMRTLPAGTYAVGESGGPGGYSPSFSGDCAADGTLTLQPGDSKTCTVTNDDPAPAPPVFVPVPDPAPTPGVFEDKMAGYWKLRGSRTSAVFRNIRRQEHPVAPIWGWSPTWTASTFRPGGCYRQVGQLAWVIGFGGGGAWRRYAPNSKCRRWAPTTTRFFLNGPNGLYNNYLVDPDGPRGPKPSRQQRLFWERTQPRLDLNRPTYNHQRRRLTVAFRTFALHNHRIELRRGSRVLDSQTVRNRDGAWVVRFDGALEEEGKYQVHAIAKRGTDTVRRISRFQVLENGTLRFP